jgi:hypothetical protein
LKPPTIWATPSGDGRGLRVGSADPALEQELAQPVDVIRVEVGEEDGFDLALGDPQPRQDARRARAGVDDEDAFARDHGRARARALRVRHRGSRAAERDVQPVGELADEVRLEVRGDDVLDQPQRDRAAKGVPERGDDDDDDQQAEQESLHGCKTLPGADSGTVATGGALALSRRPWPPSRTDAR